MYTVRTLLILILMTANAWSAELLVMAKDSCADPLCNRLGDVISCREDGVDWSKEGTGYSDPMWKIVKVPGMSKADCDKKYVQPLMDNGKELRDRKYAVIADVVNQKTKVITLIAEYADAQILQKEVAAEKAIIVNEREAINAVSK